MNILEQINYFSKQFGKSVSINNITWHYYRLGTGTPILWLTGGIRRAALGYAFLERLAQRHTIIAPDYPPVQSINEFFNGIDFILQTEAINTFVLAGQSYGGLLAQAYLAHKSQAVERLILSSTGPVNAIGKAWFPILDLVIALVRILPEKSVKKLLASALLKHIKVPESEQTEWMEIIKGILHKDLTRADAVSHFAVATDMMRKGVVVPAAYQNWMGQVIVLSAENDGTQRKEDLPRYQRLFGRSVQVFNMGKLGHTASLFSPEKYVELLEQALIQ